MSGRQRKPSVSTKPRTPVRKTRAETSEKRDKLMAKQHQKLLKREQTIAAPDAPALMPDPEQLITTGTTLPVAMKIEWWPIFGYVFRRFGLFLASAPSGGIVVRMAATTARTAPAKVWGEDSRRWRLAENQGETIDHHLRRRAPHHSTSVEGRSGDTASATSSRSGTSASLLPPSPRGG